MLAYDWSIHTTDVAIDWMTNHYYLNEAYAFYKVMSHIYFPILPADSSSIDRFWAMWHGASLLLMAVGFFLGSRRDALAMRQPLTAPPDLR